MFKLDKAVVRSILFDIVQKSFTITSNDQTNVNFEDTQVQVNATKTKVGSVNINVIAIENAEK